MLDLMLPTSRIVSVTEYGYYVMGKKATKNEAYVAMALEHEKIDFKFQVWYWGGRQTLGGQVLDFLCFTPLPQPVQVFGEYWHTGNMVGRDRYNLAAIAQMFGRQPIILWGSETDTYELALQAVRNKVI